MSVFTEKLKFLFFFFFLSFSAGAETAVHINPDFLPEIQKLSSSDVVFKQFEQIVKYNDKIEADSLSKSEQEIEFYLYRAKPEDDLLAVSAAVNIPYDTLASLNSFSSMDVKLKGKKIVVPSVKGVFVPENPLSSVEIIIFKEYFEEKDSFIEKSKKVCYYLNDRKFYFLSGKRFTPAQRAYFLDTTIRMPLDNIQVTSAFGRRYSPVYNIWKEHKGIDFAAREGSKVYACRQGVVGECLKNDVVFGNCIILLHENGLSSVYAHLSAVNVKKGERVHGGDVIGLSGSTGAVTGPHLHFEIRQNGVASDPMKYLTR